MTDEMIDTSEIPPLDESFFAKAKLRMPQRQMLVRMHVEDNEELQNGDDEFDNSLGFFDYLATENGNEVAKEILKLLGSFKSVTLDASAQEKRADLEFQRQIRREQWIVQLVVFTLSLLLVGVLTYVDRFSSAVAILLGTLVGYFFGRGQQR
ncbi:MAG TPA: hypothetical protein VF708_21785 [Pyrinomonadaceae bacterium]|jgi:hypothetical protein